MEGFSATLFKESFAEFILTPLPEPRPFGDTTCLDSCETPRSTARNVEPSPTNSRASSATFPITEADDLHAKKEIRRLKDRIRRQKTILRRKMEREALQALIESLSSQVAELKRKRDNFPLLKPSYALERHALRRLVEDHYLLREKVRNMTAVIENIRQAFGERLHHALSGMKDDSLRNSIMLDEDLQHSGSALFRQFVQELNAVYAQTDDVFKPNIEDPLCAEPSVFKTARRKEGVTEYFETKSELLMPFEYALTCQYLSRLVMLEHRQEDRWYCAAVQDIENTVGICFRLFGDAKADRNTSLFVHFAARRYQENERTVIVWRALTEGEGSFDGMHSVETGWWIVRASTMHSFTMMESCTRIVPIYSGTASAPKSLEDQFTDTILKSVEEDSMEVATKLERLLLDDAVDAIEV